MEPAGAPPGGDRLGRRGRGSRDPSRDDASPPRQRRTLRGWDEGRGDSSPDDGSTRRGGGGGGGAPGGRAGRAARSARRSCDGIASPARARACATARGGTRATRVLRRVRVSEPGGTNQLRLLRLPESGGLAQILSHSPLRLRLPPTASPPSDRRHRATRPRRACAWRVDVFRRTRWRRPLRRARRATRRSLRPRGSAVLGVIGKDRWKALRVVHAQLDVRAQGWAQDRSDALTEATTAQWRARKIERARLLEQNGAPREVLSATPAAAAASTPEARARDGPRRGVSRRAPRRRRAPRPPRAPRRARARTPDPLPVRAARTPTPPPLAASAAKLLRTPEEQEANSSASDASPPSASACRSAPPRDPPSATSRPRTSEPSARAASAPAREILPPTSPPLPRRPRCAPPRC